MNKPIDVFVMRHAEPLYTDAYDSGIALDLQPDIEEQASKIAEMVDPNTTFTLATSERLSAIQTGSVILNSNLLNFANDAGDMDHEDLSPEVVQLNADKGFAKLSSTLRSLTRVSLRNTEPGHNTGLLIVTHEPIIREFPAPVPLVNTDYLAINHFKHQNTLHAL